MAYENGKGSGSDIVLDVEALKIKVERLEDEHDNHEAILERMADTDHMLAKKIVALEVENEHNSEILKKLQKESSLQTKLLGAILTALIGAAITMALSAIHSVLNV